MAKENEAMERAEDLVDQAEETLASLETATEEAVEDVAEKVEEVTETVEETLDTAQDTVEEGLASVEEKVEEVLEPVVKETPKQEKAKTVTKDAPKEKKPATKKTTQKYVSETKKMWLRIVAIAALILVAVAIALPLLNTKSPILTNKTVLTVDGVDIPADEYSYYIGYLIDSYAMYYGYEYFQNETNFNSIKSYVDNVLKEHYVVYNWALEEGYALTDEQKQEVLDQIEETKNSFETEEEYNEALASSHLTPELYEKMLMADTVINNFSDAIYDTSTSKYAPNDVDVMTLGEENGIIASKHILLLPGDTAEEEEEILKKMNEILERINNGEDFDDLMNEFSEDPGLATYPDGYTFMDGEMVTEFYDATKALEVGGVSGIVRSSSGYHIIKRVDPDFEETKARLISLAVDADLEERLANAKVKLGKGYDKIQFSDFNILPETTDSEEAA